MKMVNIGFKLRELRKANGYTVKSLIKTLQELNICLTAKTIYRWENNETTPSFKTINILSSVYETDILSMFETSKLYKGLNDAEINFIYFLRQDDNFKKLIKTLYKMCKEGY